MNRSVRHLLALIVFALVTVKNFLSLRKLRSSALALMFVVLTVGTKAQTFDLATDWNEAQNPSGAWTYGVLNPDLSFTPFSFHSNTSLDSRDFTSNQPYWGADFPISLMKSLGVSVRDFPINRVGGHTPNQTNRSLAAQWTAPTNGKIDLSGGFWMLRNIGRANQVSVFLNGTPLFSDALIPPLSASTNSSSPFSLSDANLATGHSASNLLGIPVRQGDKLTLAVHKTASSPYGDYVGTDFRIRLTPNLTPYVYNHYVIDMATPTFHAYDKFEMGNRIVGMVTYVRNLPPYSNIRIRYQRPDGTIALIGDPLYLNNNFTYPDSGWFYTLYVNLDQLGTWHAIFDFNSDEVVVSSPFTVVPVGTSPAKIQLSVQRVPGYTFDYVGGTPDGLVFIQKLKLTNTGSSTAYGVRLTHINYATNLFGIQYVPNPNSDPTKVTVTDRNPQYILGNDLAPGAFAVADLTYYLPLVTSGLTPGIGFPLGLTIVYNVNAPTVFGYDPQGWRTINQTFRSVLTP